MMTRSDLSARMAMTLGKASITLGVSTKTKSMSVSVNTSRASSSLAGSPCNASICGMPSFLRLCCSQTYDDFWRSKSTSAVRCPATAEAAARFAANRLFPIPPLDPCTTTNFGLVPPILRSQRKPTCAQSLPERRVRREQANVETEVRKRTSAWSSVVTWCANHDTEKPSSVPVITSADAARTCPACALAGPGRPGGRGHGCGRRDIPGGA